MDIDAIPLASWHIDDFQVLEEEEPHTTDPGNQIVPYEAADNWIDHGFSANFFPCLHFNQPHGVA